MNAVDRANALIASQKLSLFERAKQWLFPSYRAAFEESVRRHAESEEFLAKAKRVSLGDYSDFETEK